MRFEINIADDRPEAKILGTMRDPSAFVLDLVRRAGQTAKLSEAPDYMASITKIRKSPSRFKTPAEVDAYLAELRAEW